MGLNGIFARRLVATRLAASVVLATAVLPISVVQPRDSFEVVSIKPAPSAGVGGRGSGAGPCSGLPRIANNRVVIPSVSAYSLISWAYGKGECLVVAKSGLISGGPEWMRSDRFEIQALMPEGSTSYSFPDLRAGKAPKLQMMLRTMLADRFKLVLHQQPTEIPVYVLTIARGGFKLQPLQAGTCTPRPVPPGATQPPTCGNYQLKFGPFGAISGGNFDALVFLLGLVLDRPVVDKTGITGMYNVLLTFAADDHTPLPDGLTPPATDPGAPSVFTAIQEQLGLKLEAERGPAEMLVIEHIERPVSN